MPKENTLVRRVDFSKHQGLSETLLVWPQRRWLRANETTRLKQQNPCWVNREAAAGGREAAGLYLMGKQPDTHAEREERLS